MFAVTMGISRVLFGKAGDKMKLNRFMIGSGILCFMLFISVIFGKIRSLDLLDVLYVGFL